MRVPEAWERRWGGVARVRWSMAKSFVSNWALTCSSLWMRVCCDCMVWAGYGLVFLANGVLGIGSAYSDS